MQQSTTQIFHVGMLSSIPLPVFDYSKNDSSRAYKARLATINDIPAITSLHFSAFGEEIEQIIPNNNDGQTWMNEALRICLEEFIENCITIVVLSGDEIVAYARYIVPTREVWENMYSEPKAVGGMKQEVLDEFLSGLEVQHRAVMGGPVGKKHLWFENLATHPDHQRRGIGRALVKFACDLADEMGLEIYLDASDDGKGLYEKFGFGEVKVDVGSQVAAAMVRKVRSQE